MLSNELYNELYTEENSSLPSENPTIFEEKGSMSPKRMAALVGFEQATNDREPNTNADIATGLASKTLESEAEPHLARTQRSFHRNPLAKLGLVGTATFTIALFASSLFVNSFDQKANQSLLPTTATTSTTEPNPSDSAKPANGKILSELAISKQEQEIDAFNRKSQQLKQAKATVTPASVVPTKPVTFSVPVSPPSREVAALPQRQLSFPTFAPQPRSTFSSPTPTLRPAESSPLNALPSAPASDPVNEWLAAAQLGSYGQVSVPAESQGVSTRNSSQQDNNYTSSGRSANSIASAQVAIDTEAEAPILTGQVRQPVKTIIVGTRAKGVLATPVAWDAMAGNNGASTSRDRFVVVLREPLKAADGSIALPAGTELITKLNSYSQSGLIDLSVVAGVVEVNGQRQEVSLPETAILIHGSEGKPLIAKLIRQKGPGGIGRALGQFALGAVRQAAELYTRQNSSVISTNGGITVTNQNPEINALAGALQGGTNALLDTLTAQNRAAIAQLQQQNLSSVWMAAAGTSVEIFVSQSVPIAGAIAEPSTASQLGSSLEVSAWKQNQPQQLAPDSTAMPPALQPTASETLPPPLAATDLANQSLESAEVAINYQVPENHSNSTLKLTWAGK